MYAEGHGADLAREVAGDNADADHYFCDDCSCNLSQFSILISRGCGREEGSVPASRGLWPKSRKDEYLVHPYAGQKWNKDNQVLEVFSGGRVGDKRATV